MRTRTTPIPDPHPLGIVGAGNSMREVFRLVSCVAASNTTALLTGETGTGKELIARAIHHHSDRKDQPMIKVNCAALPPTLIESELFGHEKGSFTDATDRRIGKFESAHNGTLFLDEIGELPLGLQSKLLRALQEKEIERIGGRTLIKTDVRIVAATNRCLEAEVRAGRFRSDLFYRLNVFPIRIPPLRNRKEDIPALAAYFVARHSRNGTPLHIPGKVLKALMAYNWPGNVRELEHLLERSVLLSRGNTLSVDDALPSGTELYAMHPETRIKTIDEVEREHILSVLRICNGKIAGVGGAAQHLQLPSTTLASKMKRLDIRKSCRQQ